MKQVAGYFAAGLACIAGCLTEPPAKNAQAPAQSEPVATSDAKSADASISAAGTAESSAQVASVSLNPENTKLQFVGTHAGKNPDPNARKGTFEKFEGKAAYDPDSKALKSVSLSIDPSSVSTFDQKLTNHLKSPDFFDVNEHPTIQFESTEVRRGAEANQAEIVGKLTLHGVTKEITIPASVDIADGTLKISSAFSIDRTEYGMTFKGVENKVELSVEVDAKTP